MHDSSAVPGVGSAGLIQISGGEVARPDLLIDRDHYLTLSIMPDHVKVDYNTTPEFAAHVVKTVGVESTHVCLEPSAGLGILAQEMRSTGAVVDCVEEDSTLARRLLDLPCDPLQEDVYCKDFLQWYPSNGRCYDRIIMCPPFTEFGDERFIDQLHVQRAHQFLAAGGKLLAIISRDHWEKSSAFRRWAEEYISFLEINPRDTYGDRIAGDAVLTVTIVLCASASPS